MFRYPERMTARVIADFRSGGCLEHLGTHLDIHQKLSVLLSTFRICDSNVAFVAVGLFVKYQLTLISTAAVDLATHYIAWSCV